MPSVRRRRLSPMRRPRLRLRTVLALIAAVAVASAEGVHAWWRHLADDSGRFYTHEESAAYQAFQEAAATAVAVEAEQRAGEGGPVSARWLRDAAEARDRLPSPRGPSQNTTGVRRSSAADGNPIA
jgi:hypothetical protein